MGEEKNIPVEKKAVSKTNTWLQVKEKEDKLRKIDEEIENAKKLKKEIKREINQGKIRVVRAEERRLDAVVGVAIRWASYADPKLQKRLMEILDEFYFDDRNRSFLGFDLFPTEKKNECEKAREAERKRRKESSGKDTNPVRITKTSQPTDSAPIIETPPIPAGGPQKEILTAGEDTSTLDDLNDLDGEQPESPNPSNSLPDFAVGKKPWNKKIYNGNEIWIDDEKIVLTPKQVRELKPFAEEIRGEKKG